jgi:hypothetical protein
VHIKEQRITFVRHFAFLYEIIRHYRIGFKICREIPNACITGLGSCVRSNELLLVEVLHRLTPTLPDLLAYLVNSGNLPSQLAAGVENELKAAAPGSKVLISIPLAHHVSENSGGLRRRDWNDFMHALNYSADKFKKHRSFGGIIISPLALVEFLRQER